MKYADEFRDKTIAQNLARAIEQAVDPQKPYRFMEFCGGHTHAISRYGLEDMLPGNVRMIHGPGCPVCVLPAGRIDMAIQLAQRPETILCVYGDLMRVPGSQGQSLLRAKARGADIRMVYSTIDAIRIAEQAPERVQPEPRDPDDRREADADPEVTPPPDGVEPDPPDGAAPVRRQEEQRQRDRHEREPDRQQLVGQVEVRPRRLARVERRGLLRERRARGQSGHDVDERVDRRPAEREAEHDPDLDGEPPPDRVLVGWWRAGHAPSLGGGAPAGRQAKRRSRSELLTTSTDENAMAAPAIIGLSSPNAASGIAATL